MEANVQTNNKLQLIEQAYDILRDPIKRDVYETANLTKLGTFLVLTETSSITISCIGMNKMVLLYYILMKVWNYQENIVRKHNDIYDDKW